MVPDLATVPRLLIRSYLVIPIPESYTERVLASSSNSILMANSVRSPRIEGSYTDMNLILSRASEAFEITSLRKISFWVYNELIMISINLPTSA